MGEVDTATETEVTCPVCDGTGYVECPECEGSGMLDEAYARTVNEYNETLQKRMRGEE